MPEYYSPKPRYTDDEIEELYIADRSFFLSAAIDLEKHSIIESTDVPKLINACKLDMFRVRLLTDIKFQNTIGYRGDLND